MLSGRIAFTMIVIPTRNNIPGHQKSNNAMTPIPMGQIAH
jgi:hypothetical protein